MGWRWRSRDGRQEIRAEDRQDLADARQVDLHVLTIRFGELRVGGVRILQGIASGGPGFLEQTVFEVADMRFREVFVLAHEHDNGVPEVPGFMLLQPVPDHLRLADVCEVVASVRVDAKQEVDPRACELVPGEEVFEFRSRRCERLAGPVRHFADPEASGIPVRQEELERGRWHALSGPWLWRRVAGKKHNITPTMFLHL